MSMFEIEKQGVSTHLTYLIRDDDNIDDLSLGMLTNNRIKGVSPIVYTQLNENRYFKFDIYNNCRFPQTAYCFSISRR